MIASKIEALTIEKPEAPLVMEYVPFIGEEPSSLTQVAIENEKAAKKVAA